MLFFKNVPISEIGYCQCQQSQGIYTDLDDFGYWDACCACGKPREDGFHYYEEDDLDV